MKKLLGRFFLVGFIVLVVSGGLYLPSKYVMPVLMYHSIDDNWEKSKLSVSPESFEKQMTFLHRRRYKVLSLDEVVDICREKQKPPYKAISITFDDGFLNNYSVAYPILRRYGFPAAIFVVVDKVGTKGYLSWKQLKKMAEEGITIGSHTLSHRDLRKLSDKELKEELVKSKKILEKKLGRSVDFICYPGGSFDERVRQAAIDAGYKGACATNPGRHYRDDDPYAIKRVRISRTSDSMFVFWIESSGFYTFVKEIRDED
jgi:peptidoglycan/xylan/chitin deacetylase (PgdA/CDA1 family)